MKKSIISTTLLSVLSFGAMAETPSFNFIQGGYARSLGNVESISGVDFNTLFGTEIEKIDFSSGYEIKGNFKISEHLYINADYASFKEKSTSIDQGFGFIQYPSKFTNVDLGIGIIASRSENSAFFVQFDLKAGGISQQHSFFGAQLSFGSRMNIKENLELNFAFKPSFFQTADDDGTSETGIFFEVGAVYKFTDSLGIYFNIDTDFSDSTLGTGVRFSF